MDNLCNRCGVCCRYIPVDTKNKILYRDSIKPLTEEFEALLIPQTGIIPNFNDIYPTIALRQDVIFFRCKFLLNENICSNPQKPQECKDFPKSAMACIPEYCGYSGTQFLKSEEHKQKIRKMKEEILHYEALMIDEPQNKRGYQKIIERLQAFIDKYAVYGSEDW